MSNSCYYVPGADDSENSVDGPFYFDHSVNYRFGVTNPTPHDQAWNTQTMSTTLPHHFAPIPTIATPGNPTHPGMGSGFHPGFEADVDNDGADFPPYPAGGIPFNARMPANPPRTIFDPAYRPGFTFPTEDTASFTSLSPASEAEGTSTAPRRGTSRPGWSARRRGMSVQSSLSAYGSQANIVSSSREPSIASETPLVCKWEGCKYKGSFQRRTELMRHLECIHVFPNAFPCPFDDCFRSFNRRDNLEEHVKKAHPEGHQNYQTDQSLQ
jgi:Zinc finger, C2H2 type